MQGTIKNILLVSKRNSVKAKELAQALTHYFTEHKCVTKSCVFSPQKPLSHQLVAKQKYDLGLVLGGDGMFISVARQLIAQKVPLLGVNLGRVGFLADVPANDWQTGLDDLLQGKFSIVPRIVIAYKVERKGAVVHQGIAINEIVISRGPLARLIQLAFSCNGTSPVFMRSDGVIVSTPIGSTAYGVSAGGSLLLPEMEAFSVVPICPFLNSFKPLVVPASACLEFQVQEQLADVSITEDGQRIVELECEDRVVVQRYTFDLLLAEIHSLRFFEKLKTKGFLSEM